MKGTCRTEVKQNEKKTRDTENTALCTDCGFYNGKRRSAASCRPSDQRTEGAEITGGAGSTGKQAYRCPYPGGIRNAFSHTETHGNAYTDSDSGGCL